MNTLRLSLLLFCNAYTYFLIQVPVMLNNFYNSRNENGEVLHAEDTSFSISFETLCFHDYRNNHCPADVHD